MQLNLCHSRLSTKKSRRRGGCDTVYAILKKKLLFFSFGDISNCKRLIFTWSGTVFKQADKQWRLSGNLCHSVCQLAFPKKICIRKNSFSKVEKCHSLIIFTWTQLRSLWRHIKMRSTSLFSTISSVWLGTRVAINQSWSLTELNVVDFKTLSCSWRYFKKCYAGFTTLD